MMRPVLYILTGNSVQFSTATLTLPPPPTHSYYCLSILAILLHQQLIFYQIFIRYSTEMRNGGGVGRYEGFDDQHL